MHLHDLVAASTTVSSTPSRKKKTAALAQCLRQMELDEVPIGVGLLRGRPPQGKIGLGYSIVSRVTAPGAAAPSLTLREVDRRLTELKGVSGAGSGQRRERLLGELLALCTGEEQDFLRRAILGAVRQGALDGVIVEGVAAAAEVDAARVRRAVMLRGDLTEVAVAALRGGEAELGGFSLQMFVPLQPMLAQPGGALDEALPELGEAEAEFKLDGARIQVHKDGEKIEVYTRKLRPVTPAVPEVVELVTRLPARRLILDGEAIALRPDGTPRPFQETMRRFGRKSASASMREEIPLSAHFFDCLVLDDQTLIDAPTRERLDALHGALPPEAVVPHQRVNTLEDAEAFLASALRVGHEGLMLKGLDAPYEAGRRGAAWRKIKPAHTLDLVVLAAEWGSGRRQGWLSNLHLGARDPAEGGFVMLGKTFKGLTDELLTWQTEAFLAREIGRDQWTVHVKPELVVEIAFDGVQASPHYPGGMALRFARVKRYRDDKTAAQADTIERVRAIFESGR